MARGKWTDESREREYDRGHHNWSSPAYQRPAVMPEDPANLACERAESRFVDAKRRAGVSWFNIARMTGRTVEELKRDHGGGK